MFKKSLVAVAALATFSAGAMAANVELYVSSDNRMDPQIDIKMTLL